MFVSKSYDFDLESHKNNMPDTEFKTMSIRILSKHEKRVDSISETANTEMRNNKAEIKGFKK